MCVSLRVIFCEWFCRLVLGGCGVYLLVCLSVVCAFFCFFYDAALVANKVELNILYAEKS